MAITVGVLSLAVFGLLGGPDMIESGFSLGYLGTAVLSTTLTYAFLPLVGVSHPPAGATVGLVSLGLIDMPRGLLTIAVGVVIVTATAQFTNRTLGVPVPLWRAQDERT